MHAMMREYSEDHVLMLDPNIRPSFIKDEDTYRTRLKRMVSLCDILKISDEDLNWMVPDQVDIESQIYALIGNLPKLVFVTKGSDGAVAFHGTEQIANVKADKVVVVDTIGAGDTFNAGILNSLANEGALTKTFLVDPDSNVIQAALQHAVKVAALTVSRSGANPPWISEL
jgi:fructokinase